LLLIKIKQHVLITLWVYLWESVGHKTLETGIGVVRLALFSGQSNLAHHWVLPVFIGLVASERSSELKATVITTTLGAVCVVSSTLEGSMHTGVGSIFLSPLVEMIKFLDSDNHRLGTYDILLSVSSDCSHWIFSNLEDVLYLFLIFFIEWFRYFLLQYI
jgi:hypothetical protein